MFEKLLSLLPYNPGLVNQLSFYSQRMREEAAIRRTGMVFIVLAFLVQFFAILSPPQPTVAASNNDLINGGVSSAADARHNCNSNTQHYGDIMAHYGINCSDIGSASTISLKSTDHNKQLFSMGRLPYGSKNPNTGKPTSETPVNIPGAGKLYVRYLWSFDGGSSSTYKALKFTSSSTHKTYYILYSCGNLVSIGVPSPYTPPKPTPKPTPAPAATPAPTPPPSGPTPTFCPYNPSIASNDTRCHPCPYNNTIIADDSNCKPCDQSTSSQDSVACIKIRKTAVNTTQSISDANNSTAQPGDVIAYTLYAENTGKAAVRQFAFQENLSDVLDYADVTDLHGGSIDGTGLASWPKQDIAAGQTASQKITVKVKGPVPQTPADPGDPSHFDLVMTNVYGNAINIRVPGSPAKTVETTTASLPNTGPGSSLLVGAAIVILGGYFYGRARLLAKESSVALQESAGA